MGEDNMRSFIAIISLSVLSMPVSAAAQTADDIVLSGVLDLPRQVETAPVDGCAKPQKGLKMDGGFLLIACEKLLPFHPIAKQDSVANLYADDLIKTGWKVDTTEQEKNKKKFIRNDPLGCKSILTMMVWKDRSMNEPNRPNMSRNDYRQIVFVTEFAGSGRCDHHYDTVKAISERG